MSISQTKTNNHAVLRQHAETQFAQELEELQNNDERERPQNWAISP